MPSFNGLPDIWDLYQQMQPGGWSPPPGAEGSPNRGVVTTSGSANWRPPGAPKEPLPEPPQPNPGFPNSNPSNQGGNMPINQTYFPNANPGAGTQQFPLAPGVAEGAARMAQIANTSNYKSRRAGGSMVTSPQGGQMFVPTGQLQGYLDKGYTNYVSPRTPVQQFDINQANVSGKYSGIPITSTQQGPGGPYQVRQTPYGGVAAPISFPNVFQRFGSDVAALGRGIGYGARSVGNFAASTFNNFFNRPTQPTQPTQPSYADTGPRRYFDY